MPQWYFSGEVVCLWRSSPSERNLTSYDNAANPGDRLNNHFVLDTDDTSFGLAPGTRLTLGYLVAPHTAIEGGFYGANEWDETTRTPAFASAGGLGPLSPYWGSGNGLFDTSAFSNSNRQSAAYDSSFNSAELGVRQWFAPSFSALAGFRFINFSDQFQLTASNDAANNQSGQTGVYRTQTSNNLVGVQAGTEYTHELWPSWLLFSVEGKAGAFANFADEKNLLFNTGTTNSQRSSSASQFSGVCDLSLALTALVTNHLTVRGGYTFLFMNGLALATDQLDTNPTMANSREFVADKGTLTLQGPFLGGELAW